MNRLITIFVLLYLLPAWAVEFRECPASGEAVSAPAPVDLSAITDKVESLQDEAGSKIFSPSPLFIQAIKEAFDTNQVKTKMGQFYTMLWVIGEELNRLKIDKISFSRSSVQNVLLTSKVFTDDAIPNRIKSIRFDLSKKNNPRCTVMFDNKNIEVPLNQGDGFYLFRNGKCQHAQKLIFDQNFSFEMKKNLGNLMVSDFKGVDLFGDFGNRGFIDVDIQYVSLKSVEFIGGTVDGRVTAYVSREEFSRNKHTSLLELVTKFVPDRSVQPIDW